MAYAGRRRLLPCLCVMAVLVTAPLARATNVYYENLPDGMHDVLVSHKGGLYITGFDSRRRVCLVLFAPPFGKGLRTVAELPYRDYGMDTPSVLAAHDPLRSDQIYVLLYLRRDNLGLEQMSLYRLDVARGTLTLLTASTSPFWAPKALLPRADGTVLVALGGLGAMLEYARCDDTTCVPFATVNSTLSRTAGKEGMVERDGMVCAIIGASSVFSEGGHLVCELSDGTVVPITQPSPEHASSANRVGSRGSAQDEASRGDATARITHDDSASVLSEPSARIDTDGLAASSDANATRPRIGSLTNPMALARDPEGTLYVGTCEGINEYGYAQGSIYTLAPRQASPGEACGAAGCWSAPQLIVRSVSNPRGLAIDAAIGTLYVVEQNTLRGYSYETFHGDVLAFCVGGRYDCTKAQNSGECACASGYGGPCCDIVMTLGSFVSTLGATLTNNAPLACVIFVACGFAILLLRLQRRPPRRSLAPEATAGWLREPLLSAEGRTDVANAASDAHDQGFAPSCASPSACTEAAQDSVGICSGGACGFGGSDATHDSAATHGDAGYGDGELDMSALMELSDSGPMQRRAHSVPVELHAARACRASMALPHRSLGVPQPIAVPRRSDAEDGRQQLLSALSFDIQDDARGAAALFSLHHGSRQTSSWLGRGEDDIGPMTPTLLPDCHDFSAADVPAAPLSDPRPSRGRAGSRWAGGGAPARSNESGTDTR